MSGPIDDVESDSAERQDAIKRRAYEISQSDRAGTAEENWERAESEIGGGLATQRPEE